MTDVRRKSAQIRSVEIGKVRFIERIGEDPELVLPADADRMLDQLDAGSIVERAPADLRRHDRFARGCGIFGGAAHRFLIFGNFFRRQNAAGFVSRHRQIEVSQENIHELVDQRITLRSPCSHADRLGDPVLLQPRGDLPQPVLLIAGEFFAMREFGGGPVDERLVAQIPCQDPPVGSESYLLLSINIIK